MCCGVAMPRCPPVCPFRSLCPPVCFVAGGARPVAPSFRPLAVCLSLLSSVVPCVRVCCGVAMPRCFLFVTFGLSAPRPFCLSCRAVWPSGSGCSPVFPVADLAARVCSVLCSSCPPSPPRADGLVRSALGGFPPLRSPPLFPSLCSVAVLLFAASLPSTVFLCLSLL
jgi:hypothetical protein